MSFTEHEMHGLIAGKCVAGDMKVNEELPAYLVRKMQELESERDMYRNAEISWEKAMMSAIGEDGTGSVTKAIFDLKAERDALAAENKVLDSAIGAIADAYETGLKDLLAQEIDTAVNTTTPATDAYAYASQLRAEGIPEQLKEIGELIRTQDNRITDQPMFVVFEKREIIGSDEHSPNRIAWVCESEEVDELRGKRLELLYQNGRDTRGYDRYAMQEIDVFVTACFTEKGCKDYLRQNRHNLRHPYIYAAGSYRNDEYQAVRNWLESLPRSASMDGA